MGSAGGCEDHDASAADARSATREREDTQVLRTVSEGPLALPRLALILSER
jgi:hypothetical protein